MKTKVLTLTAAFAACLLSFSSCKDNKQPQPDPVYVTLSCDDDLDGFTLTHSQTEVTGDVSFSFTAVLSEAAAEDVTVSFSAECEGISASKVSLDPGQVTIAKGEKESAPVEVSVSDWSELMDVVDAADYTLTVSVAESSVATASDYAPLTATVHKAAQDAPPTASLGTASQRAFTLTHGLDGTVSCATDIEFTFDVTLSYAAPADVTVALAGAFSDATTGTAVEGVTVTFDPASPFTMATGATTQTVTAKVTGWDTALASVSEAGSYLLTVNFAEGTTVEPTTGSNPVSVVVTKTAQETAPVVSLVPFSEVSTFNLVYNGTYLTFANENDANFKVVLDKEAASEFNVQYQLVCTSDSQFSPSYEESWNIPYVWVEGGATESDYYQASSLTYPFSGVDEGGTYTFTITLTGLVDGEGNTYTGATIDSENNSWTVTVVKPTFERAVFNSDPAEFNFTLVQNTDGTLDQTSNLAGSFKVVLEKAISRDVSINYNFSNPDGVTWFGYFDEYGEVTIPAGQTESSTVAFDFFWGSSTIKLPTEEQTLGFTLSLYCDGDYVYVPVNVYKADPTSTGTEPGGEEGGEEGGEGSGETGGDATAPSVGDYYYSDGTWSTDLDASKTPIAVVFWVGDVSTEDAKLKADFPNKTFKGLAVALNDVQTMFYNTYSTNFGPWVEENVTWENTYYISKTDNQYGDLDKTCGYANTMALKAYVEANGPVDIITTLNGLDAAPESSSGWYIPSAGEAKRWMVSDYDNIPCAADWNTWNSKTKDMRTTLATPLLNAGGTGVGTTNTWVSSESSGTWKGEAFRQIDVGQYNSYSMPSNYYLRAILAF